MGINETAVLVTAGDYRKSLARAVAKLGIYMPSPLTTVQRWMETIKRGKKMNMLPQRLSQFHAS
jgi:hypothetical protein